MDSLDERIRVMAGPEPAFDPVMSDFLGNSRDELRERCRAPGLLEAVDLGEKTPWLWRLNFATRGLVRDEDGAIRPIERHIVAVRFLPD
jgi:hypothetical protein